MIRAFGDGWGRVRRAPWMVAGVWLATVAVALPLALVLEDALVNHLGSSLAAEQAARGVNHDWWQEFLSQAAGLGQTFVPAIIGFAAVLRNLGSVADAPRLQPVVAAIVSLQIAISIFLAGGILDRVARDRAIGASGFFSACGVYFFRFLRLGLMAGAAYWLLFAYLHPWLFETAFPRLTRDLTVERTAFLYRLGLYGVFAAALVAVNLVVDYAKIRAVVEDRRSMIGALVAGLRFLRRNTAAALGLYLLNTLVFVAVIALYFLADSGASRDAFAFFAGQVFIVFRVAVRLQFASSQVALFQSRLAHAGYVAAPVPAWPESPAAEAIRL